MFVWEINVTGGGNVSTGEILRTLEELGFGVGTFGPEVDTEILSNKALTRLTELSYLAVNIHGCRAEVIVRELKKPPEKITNFEPPKPTFRQFSSSVPLTYTAKRYSGEEFTKNAVVFGKFRVNLYFSAGNYPASCDIIEDRKRLELFGYSFPLSWVRVTVRQWEPEAGRISPESAEFELKSRLSSEPLEVISEVYSAEQSGDILTLTRSVEIYE
jgi:hypothetical protein